MIRTRVSLLQAADEASLATLLADAAIGQQVERIVAPGVALVKKAADQPLLQALLARGLLPALSNDQPASADHSVQIDKTGLIRPIHAVPSLHLSGRLARFAEAQTAGVWQLTPATVRRAGGSRKKVLALLEELTKLQRGPLPSELADRVKQWGSYYGAAAAATLTLIEFSDPQALQELLAHPDLQTHLTPFPAGNRALAMIPSEQLPEVMQLLQRLGITVKQGLLQ